MLEPLQAAFGFEPERPDRLGHIPHFRMAAMKLNHARNIARSQPESAAYFGKARLIRRPGAQAEQHQRKTFELVEWSAGGVAAPDHRRQAGIPAGRINSLGARPATS